MVRAIAFLGWAVLALAGAGEASAEAGDRCAMKPVAELPVMMAGRRPLVRANANGVDLTLLADSGAVFSMMTSASVTQLGLKRRPGPKDFTMGGVGGTFAIEVATVERFTIAGRSLADVNFLIGGSEARVAGLLGQNVLALADAEYDLGGGMIRLLQPGDCTARSLADWAGGKQVSVVEIEPLTPIERHIIGTATVNGVPVRAVFDTGAPTTVLSLAAARRAGIKPGDAGVFPGGTASGLGGLITQSWIVPAVRYRIGGVDIGGDPLQIADLGSVPFDVLIGADFFLSHRILVAYGQRRLYFVDMINPPGQPLPVLADAGAYGRRGEALAARKDFDNAIADFTRAIELAPNEAEYLVQRGKARGDKGELLLARHDLDLALQRRPDLVEALLTRAIVHLKERNYALVRQDIDAAARAAPREADQRFSFAAVYAGIEDWRRSAEQFDLWIAAHPDDYRLGAAFNARCWARAVINEDLRKSLDDCEAALRRQPGEPTYFDSRGFVQLRLGALDRAIADYDAALTGQPGMAWSLFGRGIAKRRKGLESEGQADIAAAIQLQPDLPQKAVQIGLVSSASDPR